jgi:hypothetical protein
MRREFLKFHRDNPWVYAKLVKYCKKLIDANWSKYSMRTLISVIRFDRDLETGGAEVTIDGGDTLRVKINDHHSPYYARLFAYKHPRHEYFFEYRRVEGEQQGVVILFSDVPGEPDRILGQPAPTPAPRRLKPPKKRTPPRRYHR